MKSLDYPNEISEEQETLEGLYRRQTRTLPRRRLRFLILLKSGQCTSQGQAGVLIGIKQRAAEKLWALYRSRGVEGLLEKPHSGRSHKLQPHMHQALEEELDRDGIQTLQGACEFVRQRFGITLHLSTMGQYFKRRGIKKKTGRPAHIHKDEAGLERFKKKFSQG